MPCKPRLLLDYALRAGCSEQIDDSKASKKTKGNSYTEIVMIND